MARRRARPQVEVRRYELTDGSVTETFSVRFFDAHGQRRRRTFSTHEAALSEIRRLVEPRATREGRHKVRTSSRAGLSSDRAARLLVERQPDLGVSSTWKLMSYAPSQATITGTPAPGISVAPAHRHAETHLDQFWPFWLADARSRLRPRTCRAHERLYRSRLGPKFGHMPLGAIRPRSISQWKCELTDSGVGPDAVRKALGLLQAIFALAVEWGETDSNPARVVAKPRAGRRRTVRPISPEGVERLRGLIFDSDARPGLSPTIISVLAYAGLRPGEALALQACHVRERTLLVEQAVSDGVLKEQKTGRVYRTVDLLAPLAGDLAAWQTAQAITEPSALLFARPDGGWWTTDDWDNWRNRHFAPAAAAAGLSDRRPYDLRHSFASLLIQEQRTSIVELADQLGHSPTMTLDTYGHVFAEHRRQPPLDIVDWITRVRTGQA